MTTEEPPPAGQGHLAPEGAAGNVPSPATVERDGGRRSLRIFRTVAEVPAYRWYLLALFASTSASNGYIVTTAILVFEISGWYSTLGEMALARDLVMVVGAMTGIGLLAGVLADRRSRRRIVQIGYAARATVLVALALLLVAGSVPTGLLLLMVAASAVIEFLIRPARLALPVEIAGTARVTNALALDEWIVVTAGVAGPAGAGLLWSAAAGGSRSTALAIVYVGCALLYAIGAAALFRVRTLGSLSAAPETEPVGGQAISEEGPLPDRPRRGIGGWFTDADEALGYVLSTPSVRVILVVDVVGGVLLLTYHRTLWGFLQFAPERLGWVVLAGALGGLVGASIAAALPDRRRGLIAILSLLPAGFGLLAIRELPVSPVTTGAAFCAAAGVTMHLVLNLSLLQGQLPDHLRGRVSSLLVFSSALFWIAWEAMTHYLVPGDGEITSEVTDIAGPLAILILAFAAAIYVLAPSYRRLQ